MDIILVGYGKMGHLVQTVAQKKGHTIIASIDTFADDASIKIAAGDTDALVHAIKSLHADGIIEFSHPQSVTSTIKALLPLGIPLVVGTTGWDNSIAEIRSVAEKTGGTMLYSSNFSIGVNMFFKVVEEAAKLFQPFSEYDVSVWEMHHNQKADSPSGTALELARRIMKNNHAKTSIVDDAFKERPHPSQLHVSSTRCGTTPGTHTVFFDSGADTIELTHRARSREGFAQGAVFALEKLVDGICSGAFKPGHIYTTSDIF